MKVLVLLLAVIIIIHYFNKNYNANIRLLLYLLIVLISIFRYDVGSDYGTYVDLINGNQPLFLNYEITMRIMLVVARKTHTIWWFFAFYSLFTCYFFFRGIEEQSSNYYESLIIFMALFFLETLSLIRQGLALSIVFYAFKYVRNRDCKRYLFWVVIASLFHSTALIAGCFYFIYHFIPLKYMLILDLVAFILWKPFSVVISVMPVVYKYAPYFYKADIQGNGNNLVRIFYILLFIFCLSVFSLISGRRDKQITRYLSLISLGLVFPFTLGPHLGVRLAQYVNIFYILLIPRLISLAWKHFLITRDVYMLPFYMYYFLHLWIDYTHSQSLTPYIFYFFR